MTEREARRRYESDYLHDERADDWHKYLRSRGVSIDPEPEPEDDAPRQPPPAPEPPAPRVLDSLEVGKSLLWDKDRETDDGQIEYDTRELVIAEIVFVADKSLFYNPGNGPARGGGSAVLRLADVPAGDHEYLVVTEFPRGWGTSALVYTLEQAMQFFPQGEKTADAVYEYLQKQIDLIADTDGMERKEKQAQVNALLGSPLAKHLDKSTLNLRRGLLDYAISRHILPFS